MSKIENIRDSASGKLAELAKKSLSDHKSGKSTEHRSITPRPKLAKRI